MVTLSPLFYNHIIFVYQVSCYSEAFHIRFTQIRGPVMSHVTLEINSIMKNKSFLFCLSGACTCKRREWRKPCKYSSFISNVYFYKRNLLLLFIWCWFYLFTSVLWAAFVVGYGSQRASRSIVTKTAHPKNTVCEVVMTKPHKEIRRSAHQGKIKS